MNGHAIPEVSGRPINPDAVQTLEMLLEQARSGQIVSLAVVYSYGPRHAQCTTNTALPMELHFGCKLLEETLFNFMTKPPASKIVRAPGAVLGQ